MAFGRPRQPNDPSVMASVEAAISVVARPPASPGDSPSGWPYRDPDRGEASGADPGETASYYGLGLPRPYR
jgi:hypothetical protein